MTDVIVAGVVGTIVGALLGALGAGGSIVSLPALMYLLDFSREQAATASFVIVGISAAMAAIPAARQGLVDYRVAGLMFLAGFPGVWLGRHVSAGANDHIMVLLLSLVVLAVAHRMIKKGLGKSGPQADPDNKKPLWQLLAVGVGVGLLTGLFGVGAGFLIVPAFIMILGLKNAVAVPTSLAVIFCNSVAALSVQLTKSVAVDWQIVAIFTILAVLGGQVGVLILRRISDQTLSLAFGVFLVLIAAYMASVNIMGAYQAIAG